MNRQPAASPFLALARELRDQIYTEAIVSCGAVENALDDHSATDRPQLSTVTQNINPPLSKGLRIRLRLRNEVPKVARAGKKLLRAASPGALLLVSHQISAEFSDNLFRHAKLVGQYIVYNHPQDPRRFGCDIAALVGAHVAPAVDRYSSQLTTSLPLHRLRHWEVQINIHAFQSNTLNPRTGRPDTYMRCIDEVLRQLPGVEELTLRLMIADWKAYIRGILDTSGPYKRILLPREFIAARIVNRRGVRVFRKVCTLGFGSDIEASMARQVFPMMERVERWDEEAKSMRVVSDVQNDLHYCRFYTASKDHGYYWVGKQYQPYDKFDPAGSYQATVDAIMHGYRLWVVKGKPDWNETEEHRKITEELGLAATWQNNPHLWKEMVKGLGAQLGY